jgi:hypothetical protein
MPAESETPQENIHNIPISSGVQMKCNQILFDLILRHKSFNMNSRSDQGEFKIKAEITKKENDSVYFFKGANLPPLNIDNPEYYFQTSKVKFIPGKSNNRFN